MTNPANFTNNNPGFHRSYSIWAINAPFIIEIYIQQWHVMFTDVTKFLRFKRL